MYVGQLWRHRHNVAQSDCYHRGLLKGSHTNVAPHKSVPLPQALAGVVKSDRNKKVTEGLNDHPAHSQKQDETQPNGRQANI